MLRPLGTVYAAIDQVFTMTINVTRLLLQPGPRSTRVHPQSNSGHGYLYWTGNSPAYSPPSCVLYTLERLTHNTQYFSAHWGSLLPYRHTQSVGFDKWALMLRVTCFCFSQVFTHIFWLLGLCCVRDLNVFGCLLQ